MLLTGTHRRAPRVAAGPAGCKRGYRAILPRLVAAAAAGRSSPSASSFAARAAAVAAAGRGVPARLPGERLPDALGREARARRSRRCADHRAAPARSCRPIPGVRNFGSHIGRRRGRRRGRRPELHRALDQRRSRRPTTTRRVAKIQEVVDGYPGLYRDVLTYLKERIKEVLTGAGATIVVRIFGPDLGRAARQGGGGRGGDGGGRGGDRPEGRAADPGAAARRPAPPEAAARLGLTPGDVRRAGDRRWSAGKGRRVYRDQKIFDVVVWGRREVRNDVSQHPRPADRDARWGPTSRSATWPTSRSCRPPTRSSARAASRRIDVTCNVAGPRPRERRPRDRGEGRARSTSHASTTPSSSASTPRARQRRDGCCSVALVAARHLPAHPRRLSGSIRLTLAGRSSTLPFALIGGVFGGRPRRRRAVARLAGRLRDRAGHRRPQRHHARQPLPPPRGGGRRAVRPRPGAPRLGGAARRRS